MKTDQIYQRYQQLQNYVEWSAEDASQVQAAGSAVEPAFAGLIDDFYDAIEREPGALKVITGGKEQIERLKGSLLLWIKDLFGGRYDHDYVVRRWRAGRRHVEIGLDQVYTNVALSRLRSGLLKALREQYDAAPDEKFLTQQALIKLLDLDLAIIEDAYQHEYRLRQQRIDRLAAIGQVSAGIAHELRNPLNVIKTSVYYLLNARNASAEKMTSHLQRIDRQVGLADSVITALSDFAKLPVPEYRPVQLASFLRQVIDATELPQTIVVSIQCPTEILTVQADEKQLSIVIGNLVRNARDAMPNGGRLNLRAREVGDHVELDVVDTGVGIPAENVQRILEPLYSTKARGIGLGLAISRAILDKHHAKLVIQSTPGQGSTFTVVLPAALEQEGL